MKREQNAEEKKQEMINLLNLAYAEKHLTKAAFKNVVDNLVDHVYSMGYDSGYEFGYDQGYEFGDTANEDW